MKKFMCAALCGAMVLSLAACGGSAETTETAASGDATTTEAGPVVHDGSKIFKGVEANAYSSLDVHKEYYSWHTQFYGISETLFKIADDLSINPWLAESLEQDGNKSTITLKDVTFSDGCALTGEMVVKNLQRLATENSRFAYLNEWSYETPDDKTVVITTPDVYPLLANDLANAETGFMDLDHTTDFDNAPICTGPFKVKKFVPEGDVELDYNENYWDGDVKLDGAVFYAMGDEESKLMAMQNGEIDGYVDISSSSREIYEASPDMYTVTTVPTQRRAYAYLNPDKLPESVRKAIVLGVDKEQLALYMNGLVSAADGAFEAGTYYGNVQAPKCDVEAAKKALEDDGYTMGAGGIYEKNGAPLTINISCYAKRSIDTMSILIQEQLKNIGIDAQIKLEEEPDGTYMTDHDFEMGMYVMITDKTGEPFTFLSSACQSGVYLDACGFGNADDDALIEQLRYESDDAKKTELVDQIMTDVYDSNDYFFIAQYNKSSVLRAGASGLGESNPLQYYGIDANTTVN